MVTTAREKLFWLGCGLFIIAAVKGISWQLHEAARLRRVIADKTIDTDAQNGTNDDYEDKKQGTEDGTSISTLMSLLNCNQLTLTRFMIEAIALETLAVLVDHPNYDIRHVARRIAFNRFANDPECCLRLSRDYFEPEKHEVAATALQELVHIADRGSLIRTPYSRDSENSHATIEGILRAADEDPFSPTERRSPTVTLHEVGGDNGEIVSLRLHSDRHDQLPRPTSSEFLDSDDEHHRTHGQFVELGFAEALSNEGQVRTSRAGASAQTRQDDADMAQTRARRREAMVVEVDGDEGLFELRQPL